MKIEACRAVFEYVFGDWVLAAGGWWVKCNDTESGCIARKEISEFMISLRRIWHFSRGLCRSNASLVLTMKAFLEEDK